MSVIHIFIIVAFAATLAALMAGGISMMIGGKFDLAHDLELMEGRILLQGITLGLIIIAIFAWA